MSFFEGENIRTVTGGRWIRKAQMVPAIGLLSGIGIDSREDLTGKAFMAIRGDRHDGHSFIADAAQAGARMMIVDCDVPRSHHIQVPVLHVADTRRALAELAHAYRLTLADAKVIAITGSCGKTTTKRLVHGVLSRCMSGTCAPKSFNNDIGVPMTLLGASPTDRFIVVEVGTNSPGEINSLAQIVEPDIAVITSIGRSHLEGLRSVAGVAREKAALLSHMRGNGVGIATADSPELREHLPQGVMTFGEAADSGLRLTARGQEERGQWFEINDRHRFRLALPGKHNAINAIAAVAVARRMGVSDDEITQGLLSIHPESMRLCAQRIGGIQFFNDAYNANPDSVAAALETFAELTVHAARRVVILGDMLELGAAARELHAEVGRKLIEIDRQARIDAAVLVGDFAPCIGSELSRVWTADRVTTVTELSSATMPAIVNRLAPGDSVLIKGSRGTALERILDHVRGPADQPVEATATS